MAAGVRGVWAEAADGEVHSAEIAQDHAVPERVEACGIRLGPPGRDHGSLLEGIPVVQGESTAHARFGRGDTRQVFHAGAAARAGGPKIGLSGLPRVAADLALLCGGYLELVVVPFLLEGIEPLVEQLPEPLRQVRVRVFHGRSG